MLSDNSIAQCLAEGYTADALCKEAEMAGGNDNVSVIVATVK